MMHRMITYLQVGTRTWPQRICGNERRLGVSMDVCKSAARSASHRAALCTELGKPLEIRQIPSPELLQKGQVRVAVHSASINFADLLTVKGKYQEKPTLPFTPGSEICGEVVELGPGVTNLNVGDKVAGLSLSGGAFADEIVMSPKNLVPLPESVTSDAGAAYLISYGTAYMALKQRARVREGETVLITAAAGATGLAATELAAKIFKAKVIGACGGAEKCALVKSKGAVECIDYNKESIRDRVKEITGGKGVDVVIDNVGGDTMIECLKSLAFEGRLVVVGFASGDIPKIPANLVLLKSCSILGVYWGSYAHKKPKDFIESIMLTTDYLQKGQIQPHISDTFQLEKINDAFEFIQSRKSTGKVVIKCKL